MSIAILLPAILLPVDLLVWRSVTIPGSTGCFPLGRRATSPTEALPLARTPLSRASLTAGCCSLWATSALLLRFLRGSSQEPPPRSLRISLHTRVIRATTARRRPRRFGHGSLRAGQPTFPGQPLSPKNRRKPFLNTSSACLRPNAAAMPVRPKDGIPRWQKDALAARFFCSEGSARARVCVRGRWLQEQPPRLITSAQEPPGGASPPVRVMKQQENAPCDKAVLACL